MFSWVSLALLLLRVADGLISWSRERQQVKAGEDSEIAQVSSLILARTAQGKKIFEQVEAQSDPDLDKILKQLEG